MKKKIRAMYFTGTGTTEKITKTIASEMYDNLVKAQTDFHFKQDVSQQTADISFAKEADINFSPKAAREKEYVFDTDDIVVFGVPVIAGRVPNVLLKFLDTLQGGGAAAIPVVLYGNRNFDDALIELRNILEDKDFRTIAAVAFIGEHSFSKTLAAGRPDNADMQTAADFAKDAADKLLWLLRESEGDEAVFADALMQASPVEVEGCEPIRPYYKPQDRHGNHINILKVKPKLHEDKCNKCGICAESCPMGSIDKDALGIVNGICIKCCGCVKKCPNEALYFDDAGYIYHKEELEAMYADRKEPSLFL